MPQPFDKAAFETLDGFLDLFGFVRGDEIADSLSNCDEQIVNGCIRQLLYLSRLSDAEPNFAAAAKELDDDGVVGPKMRAAIDALEKAIADASDA